MRGRFFIGNTPSAAMAASVLHRPVESAGENCYIRCWPQAVLPRAYTTASHRRAEYGRLPRTSLTQKSGMNRNAATVDGFESTVATVAFVDLAGFSALTDVYGDASAIAVLQRFEELVGEALGA